MAGIGNSQCSLNDRYKRQSRIPVCEANFSSLLCPVYGVDKAFSDIRGLVSTGHPVYWVDLSGPEAAFLVEGMQLQTVRALAPGLIPIAFGYGRQPLGIAACSYAGMSSILGVHLGFIHTP